MRYLLFSRLGTLIQDMLVLVVVLPWLFVRPESEEVGNALVGWVSSGLLSGGVVGVIVASLLGWGDDWDGDGGLMLSGRGFFVLRALPLLLAVLLRIFVQATGWAFLWVLMASAFLLYGLGASYQSVMAVREERYRL